jgi:hypothetical protein
MTGRDNGGAHIRNLILIAAVGAAILTLGSCQDRTLNAGTGGSPGTGGHYGTGGERGSGGAAPGAGGLPSTGGSPGTGGAPSTGGLPGAGGSIADPGGSEAGTGTPTPGTVLCAGVSTCPALSQPQQNADTESYCCLDPGGSQQCHIHANLGACESGIPVYCDDASDCEPGLVCCESDVRTLFSCQASCPRLQLCKVDSECRDGKRCAGVFVPSGTGGSRGYDGFCQ